MPHQIARLREHLEHLAAATETALTELRRLELAPAVRQAWKAAFRAGQVADHQTRPGDPDELNVVDVADAMARAEQAPGEEALLPERIRRHHELRTLEDQVYERVLEHEAPEEENTVVLGGLQDRRATAVVDAFVAAVYGTRQED